jgi:hypothetical protein
VDSFTTVRHRIRVADCANGESSSHLLLPAPESQFQILQQGPDPLQTTYIKNGAGDNSAILDEEWEQWLKNAIESGELTFLTEQITDDLFQRASASSGISAALIPPAMITSARAGQWADIPESLQPMLRRTLGLEPPPMLNRPAADVSPGRPVADLNTSRRRLRDEIRTSRQVWPAYVSADGPNTTAHG